MKWWTGIFVVAAVVMVGAVSYDLVIRDSSARTTEAIQALPPCDNPTSGLGFDGELTHMTGEQRTSYASLGTLLSHEDQVVALQALSALDDVTTQVVPNADGLNDCTRDVVVAEFIVADVLDGPVFGRGEIVPVMMSSQARVSLGPMIESGTTLVVGLYSPAEEGSEFAWSIRHEEFGVYAVADPDFDAVAVLRPLLASADDVRLVLAEGEFPEGEVLAYDIGEVGPEVQVAGTVAFLDDPAFEQRGRMVVSGLGGGYAFVVTCRQGALEGASISDQCTVQADRWALSYLGPTRLPYTPPSSIELPSGTFDCTTGDGCAVVVALVTNISHRAVAPIG